MIDTCSTTPSSELGGVFPHTGTRNSSVCYVIMVSRKKKTKKSRKKSTEASTEATTARGDGMLPDDAFSFVGLPDDAFVGIPDDTLLLVV